MKIGNIMVNAAYLGSKVLTAIAVGAAKVWEGVSKYIKFADPVVESLCMKWSSDGIGLTHDDAAMAGIGQTFRNNTEITSFDELEYFISSYYLYFSFNGCINLRSVVLPDIDNLYLNNTFNGCSSLTAITIPEGVTSIGNSAFNGCSSLHSITIPDSVTSIESYAFSKTSSLTEVVIGDNSELRSIGGRAFQDSAFKELTLPKYIESIADLAFYFCRSLYIVECHAVVPPTIGSSTFYGTPNTMSIYVPDGSVKAYKESTNWSAYADRIKPMSEYVEPTNE